MRLFWKRSEPKFYTKNRQIVTRADFNGVSVDFDKPVSIWRALSAVSNKAR